ncbi:hypothetical protein C9374_013342 [Naegleria lovaniensis]|uniref:Uncharacterized protein n=1 Tax=Naegleria lovaniensis TaxID=51637 RepID=A0AA88H1Z5_NAELO|nr:uncharacterized protein C9374_013342 [Naegleria lovaniensis]KAG2391857.1 hypothetical protein C9374_013342 [Naegleria lovaniensis]
MNKRPQSANLFSTPKVDPIPSVARYTSIGHSNQRPSSSYGRIQRVDVGLSTIPRSLDNQSKRPPSRNSKIRSPSPSSSSKEFSYFRGQSEHTDKITIQDRKTLKRIKEYQKSYLPPHTCNVFYQNGRNSTRSIQCKRCSMTFSQTKPHPKQTSNTQKTGVVRPKKVTSTSHESVVQSCKENLENMFLPHTNCGNNCGPKIEEAKTLLKDNIKQLLYFYRDEQNRLCKYSKEIQTACSEEELSQETHPFDGLFSGGKRVELFDDDEYLRLMKEYGVDCEPSCFQFEGSLRKRF